MRTLYHLWLSPSCRTVRIVLAEKKLEFTLRVEPVWERRRAFLAINPAGEVPVLVEPDGVALSDATAIVEYLEEIQPDPRLCGGDPHERAEIRRLVGWFDRKFHSEVTGNLVDEKIMKRFISADPPDSRRVRRSLTALRVHLDYVTFLTDRRRWLAGDCFSIADIVAAAHLSCIDYLGDVPWDDHKGAQDWYARIKSRPSFRDILADQLPGLSPSSTYSDLDF